MPVIAREYRADFSTPLTDFHTMRTSSTVRLSILTTIGCVATGIMIFMATAGSLAQKSESGLSVVAIEGTPPSAIDTASATLRASSIDTAAASRLQAKGSCNDFDFSFLNSKCSKIHRKHVRMTHRVATFAIGHPDASPSSAQMPSATVR